MGDILLVLIVWGAGFLTGQACAFALEAKQALEELEERHRD